MKLNPRDLRTLLIGAAVAAVIVIYALIAAPLQDRWRAAREGLTKAHEQETLLLRLSQQGGSREERREALARQFRAIADLKQAAGQASLLIGQLEDLDSFRDLKVDRYTPTPARPKDNYAACSVTVVFHSDLRHLQAALYDLQEAEPRLNVERLLVAQDRENPGQLRVQMLVTQYIVKDSVLREEKGEPAASA